MFFCEFWILKKKKETLSQKNLALKRLKSQKKSKKKGGETRKWEREKYKRRSKSKSESWSKVSRK